MVETIVEPDLRVKATRSEPENPVAVVAQVISTYLFGRLFLIPMRETALLVMRVPTSPGRTPETHEASFPFASVAVTVTEVVVVAVSRRLKVVFERVTVGKKQLSLTRVVT